MPTQTITDQYNFIKDVSKAFGVIPAAYATLIDLETGFHYNHIMLVNRTDADIILKFANTAITAELTVPALSSSVFDEFSHNGIIQYKYVSAPTSGSFKLTSWLGYQ
jgi:hypothetical protein